jgi:hypothetical protein
MGLFSRTDDHQWSQQHLSHYVEGDLGRRARRRLVRHAEDCADCGRGIRAMRALLRLIPGIEGREATARQPGFSIGSAPTARKAPMMTRLLRPGRVMAQPRRPRRSSASARPRSRADCTRRG